MPKNFDYLIGVKFGKLTVVEIIKEYKHPSKARCICDCGGERITDVYLLNRGDVKSCGCLFTKHGEHGTRLYWIWRDLIKRCYNPKCKCYKWYGGKGVTVCNEWKTEYANFRDWALKNGYIEGLSIDRIDVNGNYEPSNCQWITIDKQCDNKTNTIRIEYKGETKTLKQWSEILEIPRMTLYYRIFKLGWNIERAFKECVSLNRYDRKLKEIEGK